MMLPIAAAVAGDDPDIAAKNMEARMETIASPPVMAPTIEYANLTNLLEMPPLVIMFPARIKNGMAITGKELTPLTII
jgi:hypothetical protein